MHFVSSIIATLSGAAVVSAASFGHQKRANSSTLQWLGVNESGAEFGNTVIPGELGKDYTWPNK
jgi:endoglucanase